jgi:hypothetical protein
MYFVYGSIALIAVLAWGAAFLAPDSKFWDDWVLANGDTLRLTRELGLPWTGPIYIAGFAAGAWTFKALVIVSTIVIGIASYVIAGRGLGLVVWERWLLAALVVALPLFGIRVLASVSTYSWSLAVFLVAWYLLVRRSPDDPGRIRYVAAAVLLFVSFTTASLLPFVALPVLHLLYLTMHGRRFWRGIGTFLSRFWFVLAAPVLFWIVRTLFLEPYGLYKGYNGLTVSPHAPEGLASLRFIGAIGCICVLFLLWRFMPWPRRVWLRELITIVLLGGATGALGFFLYVKRGDETLAARALPAGLMLCAIALIVVAIIRAVIAGIGREGEPPARDRRVSPILAVGLVAVALGILPYLLVGKFPSFDLWESRNQLLMPLGFAAIVVATFRSLATTVWRPIIAVLAVAAVASLVVLSLGLSLALVADWNKQDQIIQALRSQPLVRDGATIVFADGAKHLNYDSRGYSFYESDGWMLTAFGNESRLAIERNSVNEFVRGDGVKPLAYAAARYGFGSYSGPTSGPTSAVLVRILPVKGASEWTLLTNQKSITLQVSPIKNLADLKK